MKVRNTTTAKERILNAAIELFGQKGYAGTTTREIVKLAKSSLSMLDLNFSSKENLYKEVIQKVLETYVISKVSLFADIIDARDNKCLNREMAWTFIERIVDTHLSVITNPDNRALIMVLDRAMQEQEQMDINIEPAFMYIYNLQMLFEDYVGEGYGHAWSRILSFQVVTGMFNIITYPKVLNPFEQVKEYLVSEPIEIEKTIEAIRQTTLDTIRITLDKRLS